jgi:catechol 2,3-dioxygenase
MTTTPEPVALPAFAIHPDTRLGHVHLTVANLEQQLLFYQQVLRLKVHWREDGSAGLGAGGEDLLRLTEVPGARRPRGTMGLYHFALLYPDRRELARAIARLFAMRYPNAPTDHVISKTTYLDDVEGQNIELYVRSLEDGFFGTRNGQLVIERADGTPSDGREPLDLDALFAHLQPDDSLDEPLPADMALGHVHLYGNNLDASLRFYRDVLGFQNFTNIPSFQMADVSPNEKPHMIAWNAWQGPQAPPPPANAQGIRYYTIVLPSQAELDRVVERVRTAGLPTEATPEGVLLRDPAHVGVVLTTAAL